MPFDQFGIFFVRDRARRAVNLLPFLSNKTLVGYPSNPPNLFAISSLPSKIGIVHLQLLAIYFVALRLYERRNNALSIVVHGNSENRKSLWAVFRLQLDQLGDFDFARLAPRRPKIDQHDFAFIFRDCKILAVQALYGDLSWTARRVRLVLATGANDREKRHN